MKILVIKSSSLGDIIHSYDLIVYLKKKFPSLQLDWVVEKRCALLVERHPFVDYVHQIDSKEWKKKPYSYFKDTRKYHQTSYDVVFDLQGNCKSALLLLRAKAKKKIGFGWTTVPERLNFFFTNHRYNPPKGNNIRNDYLFLAQSFFNDFSTPPDGSPLLELTLEEEQILAKLPKGGVIVAPFSRWPNKEVSEERLHAMLEPIRKAGRSLFFVSKGAREKERAMALQRRWGGQLLPEISLPVLQHFLAQSTLVLAVDSLLLHLAGTTTTPTISFFGPSCSQKYAPIGKQHRVLQGSCPFSLTFEKRCPHLRSCATPRCMD